MSPCQPAARNSPRAGGRHRRCRCRRIRRHRTAARAPWRRSCFLDRLGRPVHFPLPPCGGGMGRGCQRPLPIQASSIRAAIGDDVLVGIQAPSAAGRSGRTRRWGCRRADTNSRRCAASPAPAPRQRLAMPTCSPRGRRRGCGRNRGRASATCFDQPAVRDVVDDEMGEIGLARHRAEQGEFQHEADKISAPGMRIGDGLQRRICRARRELRGPCGRAASGRW